jgi:uncharacterized protein (TIGR02145 family)
LAFAACKKDKGMPTVTDLDGNVYHTVKIGTQTWMVENLKTTHYRNGDAIPNEKNPQNWVNLATGAYVDNPNTVDYAKTYGHLYNWFAVKDARNIAPLGWHVPSDSEWTTLAEFLGGKLVASNKLRESGTSHWQAPNTGATNSTGFRALPGGYRKLDGGFLPMNDGSIGCYWATDEYSNANGKECDFNVSDPEIYFVDFAKIAGLSVRCIKD